MNLLDIQLAHFHPILVHLPIGMIMLAFGFEIYTRIKPQVSGNELIKLALTCTAITALISLVTGWLLGEEGGFATEMLFLHRWMAVAFTIATIILVYTKHTKITWLSKLYMPLFILSIVLVSLAGHYGGSMTHGEDYLTTNTNKEKTGIKNIEEAIVHADIIQPILDNKCVSCHNPNKAKGGLLLHTQKGILNGGDSGNILDTIEDKKPLFLHLIQLPLEDEDHMPPKGKEQLSFEEIALLNWWLANENCLDCKTKDLKTSKELDAILADLEEDDSPRALIAKTVTPIPIEELQKLRNAGINVYTLSKNNPLLVVNLFGRKKGLENDLEALEDYAANIVELNLANSQFNDTIVKLISPFKNLTKLQLQNTYLSDKSLDVFKGFKNLESLNLYGTKVSDNLFGIATDLANLKKLYIWQTEVTEVAQEKFQSDFPLIEIQQIPKNAFSSNNIAPPKIIAATNFFKDSLEIKLESIFDNVAIFYTVDKSTPDSTSIPYKSPFIINQSTNITAIASKEGWKTSKLNSQSFKKSSFNYKDVSLNKSPHEKYTGQEGATLIDLKRGSTNFIDGNWLGYEGSHFTATLALTNTEEISTVSIGALAAPSSWIFYPRGFTVKVSQDGVHFTKIISTTLPVEKPNTEVTLQFFDIEIPKTKAKFVQVTIKSPLKNPDWHPNPGGKSWIFIDEIILN